jgi:hypothetical protein
MPTINQFTTDSGTDVQAIFTLGANPAVGDLMVAWLALDTPLSIHAPLISTTNVQDQWVPLFGTQDGQQQNQFGEGSLRLYAFYKTANITDSTTNEFTFTFLPYGDQSGQLGIPQYPTTDFVGIMATYRSSTTGYAGLDTASPQAHRSGSGGIQFGLPSVETNGGSDVFWTGVAGLNMGTPSLTDPAATVVASTTVANPVYESTPLALYLFGSPYSGSEYPFKVRTTQTPASIQTGLTGLQDASNWTYNGPFVREGYPYEGPDQMLILRYPYHWAYTVLSTAGQLMIGRFFSQDQLAAADIVYYQNQLVAETDRDNILAAGIGGDFRPSLQVPGQYINPWKYVPI